MLAGPWDRPRSRHNGRGRGRLDAVLPQRLRRLPGRAEYAAFLAVHFRPKTGIVRTNNARRHRVSAGNPAAGALSQ
jgi:hypothetical protein